jgi:hypothetical protein
LTVTGASASVEAVSLTAMGFWFWANEIDPESAINKKIRKEFLLKGFMVSFLSCTLCVAL